jgi:hypothetical protein
LHFATKLALARSVKWLAFFADCLTFTGVPLALSNKANFGGTVKRLALLAHSVAFTDYATAVPMAKDGKRANQSSKNNASFVTSFSKSLLTGYICCA